MAEVVLDKLSKSFGSKHALRDVDMRIQDGEYVVVLGPSGAGKTTLLRTIAGLLDADGGRIAMDGRDVTRLPPDERQVAYMPQVYSLFPQLSVWENTTFSPSVKGWSPQDQDLLAREMLSMVHLIERRDALPRELSGGMQQRCALARALAADAEVLLLDEPLRALDARLRIELRNELKGLIRHVGTTAIHVTHDQEEALVVADRIAVLREGQLVEVGPSETVYSRPSSPFVANFLGEMNFFEAKAFPADGGTVRLVAGGTNLTAPARPDLIGQGNVLAGIRAEACSVEPQEWAAGQGVEGAVKRRLFMGRRMSLEVQTPLGLLKVKPLSAQALWAREGDLVFVLMPAEHILLFPWPKGGLTAALEVE
jgi:ABC-type Fe3+/spermidine/putrescine transport system ATPase subunit